MKVLIFIISIIGLTLSQNISEQVVQKQETVANPEFVPEKNSTIKENSFFNFTGLIEYVNSLANFTSILNRFFGSSEGSTKYVYDIPKVIPVPVAVPIPVPTEERNHYKVRRDVDSGVNVFSNGNRGVFN